MRGVKRETQSVEWREAAFLFSGVQGNVKYQSYKNFLKCACFFSIGIQALAFHSEGRATVRN